jgi:hypothetical protein
VALADDPKHPMAVLFAEVADVQASCFEDPQPKEAEQADEGEVAGVRRVAGRGEHGLELQ